MNIKNNIISSIVISLISLPLCLGVSLISGTPIYSGFISGIVGGMLVGLLSHSSLSITGPAVALSSIVTACMLELNDYRMFLCVVFISGCLQIIYGVLKLGELSNYIPKNTIKGMLLGIGFLIIIKHIPFISGFKFKYFFYYFINFNKILNYIDWYTFVTSLIFFVIYNIYNNNIFLKKIRNFIPASIFIIFIGIFFNLLFRFIDKTFLLKSEYLVNLPISNSIIYIIKKIILYPKIQGFKKIIVWKMGVILSLVSSIQTLISIEAIDKLDPCKRRTSRNRELIAQGVGNMTSSLLGGLPMTSVILRSSANLYAGANNKLSSILNGILLFIFISVFPSIMNNILLSSLSVLLIFTGYKLCNFSVILNAWKKDKINYFIPFFLTFLGVIFFDLFCAVLFGLLVNIVFLIFRIIYNPFYYKKVYLNNKFYYYIQMSNFLFFLNKSNIERALSLISDQNIIFLDFNNVIFMDYDIESFFISIKDRCNCYFIINNRKLFNNKIKINSKDYNIPDNFNKLNYKLFSYFFIDK